MNDETLGREGLHDVAQQESKINSLVLGFNGVEGQNWAWLVTHPMSLDFSVEEDRDAILEPILDLQKDSAIIVTDIGSDRPLPFGCIESGDLSSWGEIPLGFVEV